MAKPLNFDQPHKRLTALRWTGLALLLFAGLVFLAGQVVGLKGLDAAFAKVPPATLLALAGAALAGNVIRFLCWPYFCRALGIQVPTAKLALYYTAGMALLPTPGKLGTALRVWLLKKHHRVPVRRAAPVLVLDMLTDFLALMLLTSLALPFVASGNAAGLRLGLVLMLGLLAGVISVLYVPALPRAVVKLIYRVAQRKKPRVFAGLLRLAVMLRLLVGGKNLLVATGQKTLGWGVVCLALGLLLSNLGHANALPLATFALGAATTLGALTLLPGGLGSTEALFIAILLAGGVGLPEATIFTALTRLCLMWLPVGAGLVVLPLALRKQA